MRGSDSREEVRDMHCASCGEEIESGAVWKDDQPYCCKGCADAGPCEEEEDEGEEEEEEK
jgi:hypothetical protein